MQIKDPKLISMLPHMLDMLTDAVYIMKVENGDFKYAYINQAGTQSSGITEAAIGKTFYETNTRQMAKYLHSKYHDVLREKSPKRFEHGVLMPNGMVSGESVMTPIFNEQGEVEYIVCITRDTTERKQYEELLLNYAYQDALTKLHNRRYLYENLVYSPSIYLLDFDHFKHINDTLGHEFGDQLLIAVANRLKERFEWDHAIVRLGGDEFVIVPNLQPAQPDRLAHQIIEAFAEPFLVQEQKLYLKTSIGVAIHSGNEDIHVMLKKADLALYFAKRQGRNRFHIYQPDIDYVQILD